LSASNTLPASDTLPAELAQSPNSRPETAALTWAAARAITDPFNPPRDCLALELSEVVPAANTNGARGQR
jgi:hypothetical protein